MIAIEPALPKISTAGTSPAETSPARASIDRRELSQFLSRASKAIGLRGTVSVLLTGDERIRALNREFRGHDKTTDVLSFPAPSFAAKSQAGDLAISLDTASRQAADYGHGLQTEVKVLMVHGMLHLAGLDHETDSGEMARQEIRLRKQLVLPLGLIERASSATRRGSRSKESGAPDRAGKIDGKKPSAKPPPAPTLRTPRNRQRRSGP